MGIEDRNNISIQEAQRLLEEEAQRALTLAEEKAEILYYQGRETRYPGIGTMQTFKSLDYREALDWLTRVTEIRDLEIVSMESPQFCLISGTLLGTVLAKAKVLQRDRSSEIRNGAPVELYRQGKLVVGYVGDTVLRRRSARRIFERVEVPLLRRQQIVRNS